MIAMWPLIIAVFALFFTYMGEKTNPVYMGVGLTFSVLTALWIGHPLAYLGVGLLVVLQVEKLFLSADRDE